MQQIARGQRLPLDAVYRDASDELVDPTTPLVDILDPANVVVVNNAVPVDGDGLGLFDYPGGGFLVPDDADLGVWTARWTGTIDGDLLEALDEFEVVVRVAPGPSSPNPSGLCSVWASVEDACAPCDEMDADLLTTWMDVASSVLYALTGYRWAGECADLVYPTSEECLSWLGMTRRSGLLGRRERRSLKLPGYPVVEVTEVLIDGVAVDPDRYRVDDQQYLVYQPESLNSGDQNWPVFNDVRLPPGSVDTWSVEYVFGSAPPPGGKEAAAALGCELAKSCGADAEDCRLPARVTSITRQGVTMAVLDPLTLFQDGLTGLPEVDLWVSAMNRGNARRSAQVWVPGQRRKVRRTAGSSPLDYYGGGY